MWTIMLRVQSQFLCLEWTGPSQHAVRRGPRQHASSQWKMAQVKRPFHCKLTLTEFDWIPLPLTASLPAAGVSPSPPPPPASFTLFLWLTWPINVLFVRACRSFCHSLTCSSVSLVFVPLTTVCPSVPRQDEDVCHALLIPSLCFLSVCLSSSPSA